MKKPYKSFTPFRQERDMALEDFKLEVPLWIVACLGKQVALAVEFVGPCETYSKGCQGILHGIECYPWNNGGAPYALVALDPKDPSYVENIAFDAIEPSASRVRYSLDVQRGLVAF
jgi:hypothetical protein